MLTAEQSYIAVKLQDVKGKALLSSTTQGSTECSSVSEKSGKSEKYPKNERKTVKKKDDNFIVAESKKQYSRSKYVNSLRVGVRIVLPSGRCNVFYEVCHFLQVFSQIFSAIFLHFFENRFFCSLCNN